MQATFWHVSPFCPNLFPSQLYSKFVHCGVLLLRSEPLHQTSCVTHWHSNSTPKRLLLIDVNGPKLLANWLRIRDNPSKNRCGIHHAAVRALSISASLWLHLNNKSGSRKLVATSNHLSPFIQPLCFGSIRQSKCISITQCWVQIKFSSVSSPLCKEVEKERRGEAEPVTNWTTGSVCAGGD